MNINLQITHKEIVNVTTPMFWKDPTSLLNRYMGVLDDKTFIHFYSTADTTLISSGLPEKNVHYIAEAYSEWTRVDESLFMAMYDDAWESIRMQPRLIDTGREEAVKDLQLTQSL